MVSAETIVPAVYRSFEENYEIHFFDKNNNPIGIYNNGENTIDLAGMNKISLEYKELFIKGVLYGKKMLKENEKKAFEQQFIEGTKDGVLSDDELTEDGIYGIISGGNTFKEYLGEYYPDEEEYEISDVPEVNKVKKRVITYVKI